MRIAFIGLGAMGLPMATRLSQVADIDLTVFDLDDDRLSQARDLGRTATSFADAVDGAEFVFTVLPADRHVRAIVDDMVAHGTRGQTLVDFSTIDPSTILEARDRLAEHGIATVGITLTRSTAAAAAGELVLIAGGLDTVGDKLDAAFDAMSEDVRDVGGIDTAKAMKLANNMVIACLDVAICEAMVLGATQGLTPADVVEGLKTRGADSWPLRFHIERYVLTDELGPGRFSTHYMAKDVLLYNEMALAQGVPSVLAGVVSSQYRGTVAMGLGDHYHMIVLRWQELAASMGDRAPVTADDTRRSATLDLLAGGIRAVQALSSEDALSTVTATGLARVEAAEHLQGASSGSDYLLEVIAQHSDGLDRAGLETIRAELDTLCALAEEVAVPAQMFELARRDAVARLAALG